MKKIEKINNQDRIIFHKNKYADFMEAKYQRKKMFFWRTLYWCYFYEYDNQKDAFQQIFFIYSPFSEKKYDAFSVTKLDIEQLKNFLITKINQLKVST